jgi:hypothetical protein
MFKKLTILIFWMLSLQLTAPPSNCLVIVGSSPVRPYERLWEAVCMVESSGNPYAVNVGEQAYGIVQIRQIRLDDYAQRTGITYTLEDCFDKEVSKSIFMYYCAGDYETVARSWNGSGRMTDDYWRKVKKYLCN